MHATGSVLVAWRKRLPKRRLTRNTIVAVRGPEGWRCAAIHNGRVRPVGVPAPDSFPARAARVLVRASRALHLGPRRPLGPPGASRQGPPWRRRRSGRLERLAVGAGDDHRVAVGVLDPELAVPWTAALAFRAGSGAAVARRRAELPGAGHDVVEVGDLTEPEQDPVADLAVTADATVVVSVSRSWSWSTRTPPASSRSWGPPWSLWRPRRRWYQRLDASTSRTAIMGLGRATGATTSIRLPAGSSSPPASARRCRATAAPAPGRRRRRPARASAGLVGADPHDRSCRRPGPLGDPLADHPGRLEASGGEVDRPAEDRLVERRRARATSTAGSCR